MAKPKTLGAVALGLASLGFGIFMLTRAYKDFTGKKELHWSGTPATTLQAGDFAVKIPAGWRDAAEATDSEMKDLLAKSPGAKVMVRENFDGTTILLRAAPTQGIATKCDDLAAATAKGEGATATNVKPATFDGDPGCVWTERAGDVAMLYNVRFHEPSLLLVACGGGAPGYEAACQQVLASVSVAKK